MKRNSIHNSSQKGPANGLTFVEVLVSIVVVALLAVLAIPYFARSQAGVQRINCVSNLKQIGLAMRMWSNDHDEKFPWQVSTNQGGTLEYASSTEVIRHYLAASNELTSPKLLTCPNDTRRTRASSWEQLTNTARQISYFVGLDADETKPESILSGDRNLTTNGRPVKGAVTITRAVSMGWTASIHTNAGTIGLGDGSAHLLSARDLQAQFHSARTNLGVDSIRLVIP